MMLGNINAILTVLPIVYPFFPLAWSTNVHPTVPLMTSQKITNTGISVKI
jgi:hypothetical protein